MTKVFSLACFAFDIIQVPCMCIKIFGFRFDLDAIVMFNPNLVKY